MVLFPICRECRFGQKGAFLWYITNAFSTPNNLFLYACTICTVRVAIKFTKAISVADAVLSTRCIPSYFRRNCPPFPLASKSVICIWTRFDEDVYSSRSRARPPHILVLIPGFASEIYPYMLHDPLSCAYGGCSLPAKSIRVSFTCCPLEASITQGWRIEPQPVSSVT